jgi:arylsulfatase A
MARVVLSLAAVLAAVLVAALGKRAERPNIILFMADDCTLRHCAEGAVHARPDAHRAAVGYFDVGAYGSPTLRTPHVDRLAEEGALFTQWYATSGLCTPSRGAMLTGRYAQRCARTHALRRAMPRALTRRGGLRWWVQARPVHDVCVPGRPALPGVLPVVRGRPARQRDDHCRRAPAVRCVAHIHTMVVCAAPCLSPSWTRCACWCRTGYKSALLGKWHLGHNGSLPTARGFDYFFGTPYSHDEGYPGPFPISLIWPPVPVYRNTEIVEQPIDMATITPRMTADALRWIDESVAADAPFFMYIAYHEPHIPAFTSEGNAGRSRGGAYGDMVEQMDDSIGAIMERVRQVGNTFVFFTSDNGAWPDAQEPFTPENAEQGDGGSNGAFHEGKASTWEGGVRTPAIAWYPERIPGGRTVREMASHLDLFPTMLEYASVPLPEGRVYDGKSLVSLMDGATERGPHEFLFYWRESVLMAVRWGRYKGHFVTRSGFDSEEPVVHTPLLLFDLERDFGERYPMNNTLHPEKVATILAAADAHRAQMTFGPPQFDVGGTLLGQSWQVIPCCQRQNVRARVNGHAATGPKMTDALRCPGPSSRRTLPRPSRPRTGRCCCGRTVCACRPTPRRSSAPA